MGKDKTPFSAKVHTDIEISVSSGSAFFQSLDYHLRQQLDAINRHQAYDAIANDRMAEFYDKFVEAGLRAAVEALIETAKQKERRRWWQR